MYLLYDGPVFLNKLTNVGIVLLHKASRGQNQSEVLQGIPVGKKNLDSLTADGRAVYAWVLCQHETCAMTEVVIGVKLRLGLHYHLD